MQAEAIALRQARARARYRGEFIVSRGRADVFVISFPKSGRTWHRLLLGYYLTQVLGTPEKEAMEVETLAPRAGLKRVAYSHDGANFLDWLPAEHELVASPDLWEGREVILIVRDPRDILVSAYHHARYRTVTFDGELSEFVRDERLGLQKILVAYNRWHANRHLAARFEVTAYERMHREPDKVLTSGLRLLGMAEPEAALVERAVAFCSFDNMRRYEDTNFFASPRIDKRSEDPRAAKAREGIIGGHAEHLSAKDLAWIAERTRAIGNPFEHLHAE